jgi:hypothetical protein
MVSCPLVDYHLSRFLDVALADVRSQEDCELEERLRLGFVSRFEKPLAVEASEILGHSVTDDEVLTMCCSCLCARLLCFFWNTKLCMATHKPTTCTCMYMHASRDVRILMLERHFS